MKTQQKSKSPAIMRKKQRIAYIDNENVNVSIAKLWRKIDWSALYRRLQHTYSIDQVKMFMGRHPSYQRMYDFFDSIGYTLVFRKMIINDAQPLKWNIDTELVLEVMKDFPRLHKAVVMSGDGDFACLLEYLYQQKKLEKLIVPNVKRYSDLFKDILPSSKIIPLSNKKKLLAYTQQKQQSSDANHEETEVPFWL
jgi:uncharacterized LabA/DUF88 family protein